MVKKKHNDVGVFSFEKMRNMLVEPYTLGDELILSDRMDVDYNLFNEPFRLDGIVLGVVTRGQVVVSANLMDFVISKGMLFLVMPEAIILLKEKSEDFEATLIIVTIHYLSSVPLDIHRILPLYFRMKMAPFILLEDVEYRTLQHYFSLMKQASFEQKNKVDIIAGLGSSFGYTVSNILERSFEHSEEEAKRQALTRSDSLFERFIWLVLENYETQRRVQYYADRLHLTPKHLSKVVKEVSGMSAAAWIDEYVVMEAKARIRHTTLSIQEVAFSLNFPSATFFTKFFKKQTGFTPVMFRKTLE
jgi:AraC-type DNA-binding domain-containing proteins